MNLLEALIELERLGVRRILRRPTEPLIITFECGDTNLLPRQVHRRRRIIQRFKPELLRLVSKAPRHILEAVT